MDHLKIDQKGQRIKLRQKRNKMENLFNSWNMLHFLLVVAGFNLLFLSYAILFKSDSS